MAAQTGSDALLDELKSLHPLMIDLSLDRIERLLVQLGSPEQRLPPVIHVAGTNGKGSTCAYLRAMLEAAGRRVQVYTSPHLVRFHERIALPGPDGRARPIPEAELVRLLRRVADINAGAEITFFEITTAAALLAFAETPADVLILEVGLGGRLDTTNVVSRPAVTVITPVSMDHAEKLGGTLSLIAREKAGILKRGVPCIVSQQEPEALDVIEAEAQRVGAPLLILGRDFDAFVQAGRMVYQTETRMLDLPRPGLLGPHQVINAGAAVAAVLALTPALAPSVQAIEQGLQQVDWPARMARLTGGPLGARAGAETELWLDGGHNPAAGRVLAQTLADLDERAPKPVYVVAGMMGQKDAAGFFAPFRGIVRKVLTVPIPGAHEPAHDAPALARVVAAAGLDAEPSTGVPEAITSIEQAEPGPKRILVCGSLYLAGHVLALQSGEARQSN